MSDKQPKDKDGLDIDTIMDTEKLEELRKKYAAVDNDDNGSKNPAIFSAGLPEESNPTQPDAPTSDPANSDVQDDQLVTEVTGEIPVQNVPAPKTESFSVETLNQPTPTFRVVYEQGSKPDVVPSGQTTNEPSPALDCAPGPEQTEPVIPQKKKEPTRDYLAGMRIVYEEPEEAFFSPKKQPQPAVEQPVFSTETAQQAPCTDSLIKTDESSGTLADLFEQAKEQPSVKDSSSKRFTKSIFPHKGDSIGEILRKTVLNIAVLTMLVCGGILLNIYVVSPYLNTREAQKTIQIKTNSNLFANWVTAKDKYPDTDFPTGMKLSFAELFVTNKDFAAWLDIPNIGIDLPVVRGKNNAEYLTKSFYGEKSKYGCCFIDSSNGIAQLDRNTVIYGHNMQSDDLMLGPLESYKNMDGFKGAPLISLSTLYKDTKWKIYAVFISNGAEGGDNGYLFNYIFRNLSSDDAFSDYIRQIDQRKLYTTGVDIQPDDKILTVSTCVYDFKDARLAVVARMVREGESEEVDLSKATTKKNPRYPQAWYTAKGQTNPYKNAERWFPN